MQLVHRCRRHKSHYHNGFLLTKNKYSENSLIVEIFTLNHGKCSGLVYGGTSRKIKNYLQLGNKIYAKLKAKNDNKIGYFQIEIIDPLSPYFFNNYQKLNCLLASVNILKTTLPELQSYKNIYNSFSKFLNTYISFNVLYYFFFFFFLLCVSFVSCSFFCLWVE